MAIIPGHIEDEIVVIGNHNDACTSTLSRSNFRLPPLIVR